MKSDDSEEGYPESAIIGLHSFKGIDDDTDIAEPARKRKKSSRPTADEVHDGNDWNCQHCDHHNSGERKMCGGSGCRKWRDGVRSSYNTSEEGIAGWKRGHTKRLEEGTNGLNTINKCGAVGTFQKLLVEALANKKFHKYFRPLMPNDRYLVHGIEVVGREGLKQLCIQTMVKPAKTKNYKHASAMRNTLTQERLGEFELIGDDNPYVRAQCAETHTFVFKRPAGWDKAWWIQQAQKYQN